MRRRKFLRHSALSSFLIASALMTGCHPAMTTQTSSMEYHAIQPPPETHAVPLRFGKHNFVAYCFNAIGCHVIYANYDFTDSVSDQDHDTVVSAGPPSGDYRANWNASHIGIENFPSPAEVSWKSLDGVQHHATVDIAAIFKDQLAWHKVPKSDMADFSRGPVAGEPDIFVEGRLKRHVQQDELTALIDKTATLMAQYEHRGGAIDARLQALSDALQGLAQQLPGVLKTSADGVLQALSAEIGSLVRSSLEQSVTGYRQRVDAAGHHIQTASQALARQISQLQRLHRQLIWKSAGGAVVALALLPAGGAWLSMHCTRAIRDNQVSAELLKAYNGADVTVCGEGNLCANVDTRGGRYGEHRQDLPARPR